MSYIFIIFSLTVPSIFIFYLVYSVILKVHMSYGEISLYSIVLNEIWNTFFHMYFMNNRGLGIISNAFILSISGFFVLEYINTNYSSNIMYPSSNRKFLVWSYNDISVPNNSFYNPVRLNPLLGCTYDWLISQGAISQTISTGSANLTDYNLIYDNTNWYRTSNGMYYKQSYLKSRFSDSTNIDLITSVNVNTNFLYSLDIPWSYTRNIGVIDAIKDVLSRPTSEPDVDTLTATLFTHLFKYDNGYKYSPQAKDTNVTGTIAGKIDYKVSYLNNPIVIVENKHSQGDSWLDALAQAHRYCIRNDNTEVMFVVIFRGTLMSAFLHVLDWHSDNNFHLKHPDYQDLIGLDVNHLGVRLIPQSNTFHPQMKIYDLAPNIQSTDNLACASILSYISAFRDTDIQDLDDNLSLPLHNRGLRLIGASNTQNFMFNNLSINSSGRFVHH